MTKSTSEALPQSARPRLPRPSTESVTVRDVARFAGVSVATVSRVLNGNPKVDPQMRSAVKRIAGELGYTPHAAAKALATQRSTTVGAIVPTLEESHFAVGVAALQQRLNKAGYTLLLASSNYDADEEMRQVHALASQGVAAMLLVGALRATEVYETLSSRRIPFINSWVLDEHHPCVGYDNRAIGKTVANYLLDLGHVRFGVIAQHSPFSDRAAGRTAGIREALAARGVAPPMEHLIDRSHKIIDGQLALRTLLAQPQRPTAVICGTDTLAFGALVGAQEMGLQVPNDLSITGINDVEFAAHLNPALTTIRLSVEEIGQRAAEYLLGRIAGTAVVNATPLPFSLIVRGSTGAPRA